MTVSVFNTLLTVLVLLSVEAVYRLDLSASSSNAMLLHGTCQDGSTLLAATSDGLPCGILLDIVLSTFSVYALDSQLLLLGITNSMF
jgi:hypothetical protein